MHLEGGN